MRYLLLIALLCSICAQASYAPVSGTFTNVLAPEEEKKLGFSLEKKPNDIGLLLIVILNESGHQFLLSCYSGTKLGFATETTFKEIRDPAIINAGQYCPFKEAKISFDFETVTISFENKELWLAATKITTPIKTFANE